MASIPRRCGVTGRRNRPPAGVARMAGIVLMAGVAAGCGIGGHSSSPGTSRPAPAPTTTAPVTSTTGSGPPASGPRTVLSPVGLNVRKSADPSAPVLGTAAQGVVLTVVGYTAGNGGWFQVKGATVTGWISAKPAFTAPGTFRDYNSSQFSALYPATWTESALAAPATTPTSAAPAPTSAAPAPAPASPTTVAPAAPTSVAFHPLSGPGDIVVTSAASVAQLPHGRAGYGVKTVSQVVACGITAGLVVFERSASPPAAAPATSVPEPLAYLAEVRFAVDKQHALGFYADMADLGPTLQTFKDLLASVTFNAPQCSG